MNINELIEKTSYEKNIEICKLICKKYFTSVDADDIKNIKDYLKNWSNLSFKLFINYRCWDDECSDKDHMENFKSFFEEKQELITGENQLNHNTLQKLITILHWLDNDEIVPILFFKKYIDSQTYIKPPYRSASYSLSECFKIETIDIYDYYRDRMDKIRSKTSETDLIDEEHKKFIKEKNWLKHEKNVYIYLMMRDMRDKTCPLSGSIISLT